jgi:hypothetical protein
MDKVIACMASIPCREHNLNATIKSIIKQVDHLYVYLNNYDNVPNFLKNKKITYQRSQNFEDIGAAGKFYWIDSLKDTYIFTIDDDIIYPSDYVLRMVNTLKKYNNKVVVSSHGSIFAQPIEWYFSRCVTYTFQEALNTDRFINLIGTGCLSYHSNVVDITFNDLYPDVKCDLVFSIKCYEQNIPAICIKRPMKWLKFQKIDTTKGYYNRMLVDDEGRGELAKKYDWSFNHYKSMIKQWIDDNFGGIDKFRKIPNIDNNFINCMITNKLPNNWNKEQSHLYYQREIQRLKMMLYKRENKKIENVDRLCPFNNVNIYNLKRIYNNLLKHY